MKYVVGNIKTGTRLLGLFHDDAVEVAKDEELSAYTVEEWERAENKWKQGLH